MRIVEPPGDRSTRTGAARWATPEIARADRGLAEFLAEIPPASGSMMRALIREKRELALQGRLHFCECTRDHRCSKPSHDVKQSRSYPRVLEMRWNDVTDETNERLGVVARMYFTEPSHLDELTYLLFRAKHPARPDWREEQTAHMGEAEQVLRQHFEPLPPANAYWANQKEGE